MKKISTFVFFLVVAIVLGGGVFLATWDFPAPQAPVERVLPDDRFPG